MEGCYNKIFLSKDNVPAESYAYFVDILLNTVRVEIADCLEKAHETISAVEAARILFFEDTKSLLKFANARNWTILKNSVISFDSVKKGKPSTSQELPSEQLACRILEYAKELEMIV